MTPSLTDLHDVLTVSDLSLLFCVGQIPPAGVPASNAVETSSIPEPPQDDFKPLHLRLPSPVRPPPPKQPKKGVATWGLEDIPAACRGTHKTLEGTIAREVFKEENERKKVNLMGWRDDGIVFSPRRSMLTRTTWPQSPTLVNSSKTCEHWKR
jgi:hypothetical protein